MDEGISAFCPTCGGAAILNVEGARAIYCADLEYLEVLTIALLEHQRVNPHHSDLCDLCRLLKKAMRLQSSPPAASAIGGGHE